VAVPPKKSKAPTRFFRFPRQGSGGSESHSSRWAGCPARNGAEKEKTRDRGNHNPADGNGSNRRGSERPGRRGDHHRRASRNGGTERKPMVSLAALLDEAVRKPGYIHEAYSRFRGWRIDCHLCMRPTNPRNFTAHWHGLSRGSRHPIHRRNRLIPQIIKPPARPGSVPRFFHQATLQRIIVQVVQFFQARLLTPDVHVIAAPLPNTVKSVVMDGRRQFKPRASIFWHQGKSRFRRRFLRMKLAVRSRSFCMIWEGSAKSDGQIKRWQSRFAGSKHIR